MEWNDTGMGTHTKGNNISRQAGKVLMHASSIMSDLSSLSYKALQALAKQHGISAKQKVRA